MEPVPSQVGQRSLLLPNGRIFPAAAGISCVALEPARTLAQRGLFPLCRTHTRSLLGKPHTAATRASRRAAGARHTRRVDRDDFFRGGKIGTNGPFQADEALPVALSERYENTGLP